MYWLAILMEPTVTEEVLKEIDKCQVLLLLCLIDGATISVLLLNVLVHGMSYGRWMLLTSSSLSF